jgi:hypothetical protein
MIFLSVSVSQWFKMNGKDCSVYLLICNLSRETEQRHECRVTTLTHSGTRYPNSRCAGYKTTACLIRTLLSRGFLG